MLIDRTLEPAGAPGARPTPTPRRGESRGTGTFGTIADASGEAMRSMAMDPVSAARQTLSAVRRHPYMTAVLLLLFGSVIVGLVRS